MLTKFFGGGISSIPRDTSEIMKGLLILLIILGHNTILINNISGLFDYLYSFHVLTFFILPWFYTTKFSWNSTIKRSTKLWFWYLAFFVVQVVFYNLLFDTTFSLSETIKAFFLGGHTLLKGVTGYMYLWFMPAFFFSMLIRDIYTIANKPSRIAMVLTSLGIVIFFAFRAYIIYNYIAVIQGIFFAALGIVASQLTLPTKNSHRALVVLLFVVCSVLMFIDATKGFVHPFMPFVAFFAIWSIIEWLKKYMNWLQSLGKLSMFIYLTHPLIFQFLLRVVPNNYSQVVYGIIILLLTTLISIIVSWCMQKTIKAIPVVNKYL